ncbi:hypothetical protein F8R89_31050 [Streptomyces sp. SS1-1]|uniref:hypothetical protein n=1 Tax=Streptomyces sp. SS1-1 TaxID=2651869 RepID=UPI00125011B3|nr:hypothetical protein [Streptomyces sp. SS1-1]KAB2976045.1 hypothetical protein F8R89_31050 [Streptomyces sp. SS1-1]
MLQRLNVRDGQTEEQARARFDADLGVSAWALPGRERREIEPQQDPGAPWWWRGAEDASQGFLASMGVTLQ